MSHRVTQPARIQLRRTKGWRKPEGAIVVARPSRWGNPFKIRREYGTVWAVEIDPCPTGLIQQVNGNEEAALLAVALYRGLLYGWSPATLSATANFNLAYAAHRAWLNHLGAGNPIDRARTVLRGHDLACWCPLDQPCHADVLLDMAKEPG